jgi:hypothetical protein
MTINEGETNSKKQNNQKLFNLNKIFYMHLTKNIFNLWFAQSCTPKF